MPPQKPLIPLLYIILSVAIQSTFAVVCCFVFFHFPMVFTIQSVGTQILGNAFLPFS